MAKRRRPHATRFDDESGVVAIVVAISLTLLLLMASYVLDLAMLRTDRSASQSIADMAVTAGAAEFATAGANPVDACNEAITFTVVNIRGLSGPATPVTSCSARFSSPFTCDPTDAWTDRSAEYTIGNYRIWVTHPVADDDDAMGTQAITPDTDGSPCNRIAVTVELARDFILGSAVGQPGGTTRMDAVALTRVGGNEGEYASLIVLDRLGCEVLSATGNTNAEIRVNQLVRNEAGVDVTYPGIITVDARADSCNANKPVIYVSGNASITADDHIFSYGLRSGSPRPQVYDESYVPPLGNQLQERPEPGVQITRSPVDHLVNCLPDYSSYTTQRWSPSSTAIPASLRGIDGCDEGTPAYVQSLHSQLNTLASPGNNAANAATVAALNAAGWSVFPDDPAFVGQSCNAAAGVYGPADLHNPLTDGTRFYINCGATSNSFSPATMEFRGVRTIVHRNGFSMSGGSYTVVGPSDRGSVIYIQRGGVTRSGGTVNWRDVFVYIEDGRIDMSGSGVLTWRTPLGSAAGGCPTPFIAGSIPPASCFSPVALWSNYVTTNFNANSQKNFMGGQSTLNLAGSFFTPNSVFNLSGQAPYVLTEAQFFTRRLETSGQASVTMTPNPDTTIAVPITGTGLIR